MSKVEILKIWKFKGVWYALVRGDRLPGGASENRPLSYSDNSVVGFDNYNYIIRIMICVWICNM